MVQCSQTFWEALLFFYNYFLFKIKEFVLKILQNNFITLHNDNFWILGLLIVFETFFYERSLIKKIIIYEKFSII